MRAVAALLCVACFAVDARAELQVWLNPGGYSLHFDRNKELRDDNIGLGVELVMASEHAVSLGTFNNSNRERSRYAAMRGAFDGYPNYRDGGWFVAPLPLLAVEGGALA